MHDAEQVDVEDVGAVKSDGPFVVFGYTNNCVPVNWTPKLYVPAGVTALAKARRLSSSGSRSTPTTRAPRILRT